MTQGNEYLKMMQGCEIVSLQYEGVVGVDGLKVIQNGEIVDYLDTESKIKSLFDEMFQNEFGGGGLYF